jgi:hypothetical protein
MGLIESLAAFLGDYDPIEVVRRRSHIGANCPSRASWDAAGLSAMRMPVVDARGHAAVDERPSSGQSASVGDDPRRRNKDRDDQAPLVLQSCHLSGETSGLTVSRCARTTFKRGPRIGTRPLAPGEAKCSRHPASDSVLVRSGRRLDADADAHSPVGAGVLVRLAPLPACRVYPGGKVGRVLREVKLAEYDDLLLKALKRQRCPSFRHEPRRDQYRRPHSCCRAAFSASGMLLYVL